MRLAVDLFSRNGDGRRTFAVMIRLAAIDQSGDRIALDRRSVCRHILSRVQSEPIAFGREHPDKPAIMNSRRLPNEFV